LFANPQIGLGLRRGDVPKVGDVYDNFGQIWIVTKVFPKKKLVWVDAASKPDVFGKVGVIRSAQMAFQDLESLVFVRSK